jgi:hypothetical protein
MHMSQSLFNLTTVLRVSGVTITHLQEHKTTVTTASGNRYAVIELTHHETKSVSISSSTQIGGLQLGN